MTVQEFPLAWRWTQPSHAVLPPEVLGRIRPLNAAEAKRIQSNSVTDCSSAVSCSTHNLTPVTKWLRRLQQDTRVSVYVCWSEDLAIETSWGIFTDYWDDFVTLPRTMSRSYRSRVVGNSFIITLSSLISACRRRPNIEGCIAAKPATTPLEQGAAPKS